MLQKATTMLNCATALVILITGLYIQVNFESWLEPLTRLLIGLFSIVVSVSLLLVIYSRQVLDNNASLAAEAE